MHDALLALPLDVRTALTDLANTAQAYNIPMMTVLPLGLTPIVYFLNAENQEESTTEFFAAACELVNLQYYKNVGALTDHDQIVLALKSHLAIDPNFKENAKTGLVASGMTIEKANKFVAEATADNVDYSLMRKLYKA